MLFFSHNDPASLEAMLEKCKGKRVLVAFEGVYSMDGDLVRLPEILEVCAHYKAATYIDEAHSTLMFGPNGRGVAEHFGLEHEIGRELRDVQQVLRRRGRVRLLQRAASSPTSRGIRRPGTSPARRRPRWWRG